MTVQNDISQITDSHERTVTFLWQSAGSNNKRQTLKQNPGILYPGNKAKILLLSLVFIVFAEATLKEALECNW